MSETTVPAPVPSSFGPRQQPQHRRASSSIYLIGQALLKEETPSNYVSGSKARSPFCFENASLIEHGSVLPPFGTLSPPFLFFFLFPF